MLVVNLCCRDVSVTREIRNFSDIHTGIEQEPRRGGPQRMRRINTSGSGGAVRTDLVLDGSGQLLEITFDKQVHRDGIHRTIVDSTKNRRS